MSEQETKSLIGRPCTCRRSHTPPMYTYPGPTKDTELREALKELIPLLNAYIEKNDERMAFAITRHTGESTTSEIDHLARESQPLRDALRLLWVSIRS